jgi:hypothetical protein
MTVALTVNCLYLWNLPGTKLQVNSVRARNDQATRMEMFGNEASSFYSKKGGERSHPDYISGGENSSNTDEDEQTISFMYKYMYTYSTKTSMF